MAAILGLVFTGSAVAGGAAASAVTLGSGHLLGVSSSSPLPARTTESQANRIAAATQPDAAARPDTSTPNGFILQHPGTRRSDYVYDSSTVYQGSYHCVDDECTLLAEVTVQLHEVALGGSSHTWDLTMNMKEYKNPGHITWSYFATYWCGVNVKGASDHECDNGAAPSDASMSHNTGVYKPWGKTNNITVFPMVQASTQFSNGPKVTTKFRGWDTLSRARTTKLNTSSGTGN